MAAKRYARRVKGAGSWTTLSDGRIQLRVEIGAIVVDGVTQRRRATKLLPPGTGRKDIESALAHLVDERRRGHLRLGTSSVRQIIDDHLELAGADWQATYLADCRAVIAKHLPADFARCRADAVDTIDIKRLYASLRAGGVSPDRMRRLGHVLSGAYREAIDNQIVTVNPCQGVKLPPIVTAEVRPPSVVEVKRLVAEAVRQGEPIAELLIELAASTGARRGEMGALTWPDIDLQARTITVRRATKQVTGGPVIIGPTKTRATRVITIDDTLAKRLAHHRTRQAEGLLAATSRSRHATRDDRFVLSWDDGLNVMRPDALSTLFAKVRAGAGVDCGLHDLRHFHATQLIALGVPIPNVSKRLGHASAVTTLRVYAHAIDALEVGAGDLGGTWRIG